ncbi:MAG: sugar phosphate isomerase/epimerase [Deltaproteobacteria bacterium]|nr:sugar phosphate isomerase/epimerase [Candidatus Anaeroferrophillus wilburensis]MBN2890020.1 sugar phosphate isomerase/epimerase [Deltaproteobacteria bacterium]
MPLVLSAGTLFHLKLSEAFAIAKECQFDGVELIINEVFERLDPRTIIETLIKICPIASIHAPFFKISGWGNQVKTLLRTIDLANEFQIPLVNFHPPLWLPPEFTFWRWFRQVKDFQQLTPDNQTIITIENMPYVGNRIRFNPNMLRKTEDMVRFIEKHNLYMTFDTTHLGSHNPNFLNGFKEFYQTGRIRNIHFSDYGHGREHLFPGRGLLPLTRFLYLLKRLNYEGAITVELSPAELPPTTKMIITSLRDLREYLVVETS